MKVSDLVLSSGDPLFFVVDIELSFLFIIVKKIIFYNGINLEGELYVSCHFSVL